MAGSPDALYLISDPVDGATIARTWISQGGVQKFLLNDGMNSDDFIAAVGKEYLGRPSARRRAPGLDRPTEYFNANYQGVLGHRPGRTGSRPVL